LEGFDWVNLSIHISIILNFGPNILQLGSNRSAVVAASSGAAVNSGSDFDGHKQDKNADLSDDYRLFEIEKLLKVKRFSRWVKIIGILL